ncbi:MAG: conjugal transfer protein TraG N-terminal domain-containing protein [Halopseudomonas aestusnigri]|nr:conjugal transfer protein TraG N-terminal domain-containing protein [Halopseudomonas aestusnigri]
MDFTVYTAGSPEFLEIMLNSTAMITGSGRAEDLAKIGALIGVLLTAFQAVFQNQPIGFQKPALLVVLYLIFFGPVATVVIQDTTSTEARVVDNIPIGVAFVGSTLSTVSYGIAQTTEQAMSTPGMTEYGLFSSLYTMSAVRDALRNPTSLDSFNNFGKGSGKNLPLTLNQHIVLCVANPSEQDVLGIEERQRASNGVAEGSLGAIASFRESQYTPVYDGTAGPGVPAMKSCKESSQFLLTSYAALLPDMMQEVLEKGFSSDFKQGRMTNGAQLLVSTQQAIDAFGITGKSAQEYAITSSLMTPFNNGRADGLAHWHGVRAAAALRDSLNQQEMQWAARGDIFKHYMKPMIAFFEGLLYGITPFMAFALVLGSFGVSILGKYLILPFTVGLWMPLLSLVNAFTLWYAGAQIEPILNSYDPTSSGFALAQVMDIDHAISKALGVGGYLAASVPVLALAIVSGSAYVTSTLMGNISQGDKFKSEDVTPRLQQNSPALATSAMYSVDQTTQGASITGTREKSVQFTGQEASEASVQSANSYANESMSSYTNALGTGVSNAMKTGQGRDHVSSLGQQDMASMNLSSNSSFNEASSTLRSLGFTENQIAAGVYTAKAGLGFDFGIQGGASVQDSEQFQNLSSEQQSQAKQAMAQIGSVVSSSSSQSDKLETGERFVTGTTSEMGVTNTEQITQTASEAKKATEMYQEAASNRESLAAQQTLDLKQVASNSLRNGSTANDSSREDAAFIAQDRFFNTPEDRQHYGESLQRVRESGITTDDSEARMAAVAMTLKNQGRLGELVNSEFNPFDMQPSVGRFDQNEQLKGQDVGAPAGYEGMAERFDAVRGSNGQVINGALAGYSHDDVQQRGREQLETVDQQNRAEVKEHGQRANEYIDSINGVEQVELDKVASPSPIRDHNDDSAQSARASANTWGDWWEDKVEEKLVQFGLKEEPERITPDMEEYWQRTNPETGEVWTVPQEWRDSDVPYQTPWEEEKSRLAAEESWAAAQQHQQNQRELREGTEVPSMNVRARGTAPEAPETTSFDTTQAPLGQTQDPLGDSPHTANGVAQAAESVAAAGVEQAQPWAQSNQDGPELNPQPELANNAEQGQTTTQPGIAEVQPAEAVAATGVDQAQPWVQNNLSGDVPNQQPVLASNTDQHAETNNNPVPGIEQVNQVATTSPFQSSSPKPSAAVSSPDDMLAFNPNGPDLGQRPPSMSGDQPSSTTSTETSGKPPSIA